jgi:hypothetical protein
LRSSEKFFSSPVDAADTRAPSRHDTFSAVTNDIVDQAGITDEELAALALAADPDQPLDADAVAFDPDGDRAELLPSWYMPAPMARSGGWIRRIVIGGIVGSMLAINAVGLCVTYGFPEIAW